MGSIYRSHENLLNWVYISGSVQEIHSGQIIILVVCVKDQRKNNIATILQMSRPYSVLDYNREGCIL